MSTTPSDARLAAENALWLALQDRRKQIRAAGLGFGERQHLKLAEAHAKGELIKKLCEAMENYKRPRDDHNLRGMAKAMNHGLETWEEVLISPGKPWSPYVSRAAVRGARNSIADAKAFIPYL